MQQILSYPILSYPLSHSRFIIFMFTFIVAIIQAGAAEADTTQQFQHQCYYYDCLRTSWQALCVCVCWWRSGLKARKKEEKSGERKNTRKKRKNKKEWAVLLSWTGVCWQAPSAIPSFASPSSSIHSHGSAQVEVVVIIIGKLNLEKAC